jgi:hypothetical protein
LHRRLWLGNQLHQHLQPGVVPGHISGIVLLVFRG